MSIVNDPKNEREYAVLVGDTYLTKDAMGKYVILRDETIFGAAKDGGIDQCYTTEALVDPKPSKKEIFKYKLKGAVKESMFVIGHQLKDN